MSHPTWLVVDPVDEVELGTLKSGKEAQIDLVERIGADGARCLLARKRYLPREVTEKGTLEALGAQRATAFRNDVQYREGRQFRKSRDRRAVERMTTHGRRLLQDRWLSHEHTVMGVLHAAGCPVPLPVAHVEDCFWLEYLGERDGAAPQLAAARLGPAQLREALEQVVEGLRTIVAAGWAHGDLSAYNLLWWQDRVWFIDFPQAVDLAANPSGLEFLHRDVVNVCTWFGRHGVAVDADALFADLLVSAFG